MKVSYQTDRIICTQTIQQWQCRHRNFVTYDLKYSSLFPQSFCLVELLKLLKIPNEFEILPTSVIQHSSHSQITATKTRKPSSVLSGRNDTVFTRHSQVSCNATRSGRTVAVDSLSRGTIIPLPAAPMDVSIASGTCTTPCRYVVVGLVGSTYFSCRSYSRYTRSPANAVASYLLHIQQRVPCLISAAVRGRIRARACVHVCTPPCIYDTNRTCVYTRRGTKFWLVVEARIDDEAG